MAAQKQSRFISGFGIQVLAAMVVGVILGLVARNLGPAEGQPGFALAETLRILGSSFIQLLKALVPPLVFTAIVASIANLADLQNAARLVWRTLLWFAITALIAVVIGISLGLVLQPGLHAGVTAEAAKAPSTTGSWLDFLTGLVPSNFLGLSASTKLVDGAATTSVSFNVLQILVISLVIGVAWGAVAGYVGGKVDEVMMRFVDVLYSLPFIFFVILLTVTFGSNIVLIFVAIGAVEWLTMSRIVRGQTLTLKNKEFIEAARAAGLGQTAIIARHIVPNLLGPVVVYVTLTIPAVILAESFLSFLGLGVQPPMASLGALIAGGASDMELAPWLLVFPSLVMVLTLMCFNFIGDGLRDAIDPKDR